MDTITGKEIIIDGKMGKISGYNKAGERYYRMWVIIDGEEIVIKGHDNIKKLLNKEQK